MHLADLVGATRVVEDALGRRRLTGVDVRHDPDVPGLLEGVLAGHEKGRVDLGVGKKNGPLGPARTSAGWSRMSRYVLEVSILAL